MNFEPIDILLLKKKAKEVVKEKTDYGQTLIFFALTTFILVSISTAFNVLNSLKVGIPDPIGNPLSFILGFLFGGVLFYCLLFFLLTTLYAKLVDITMKGKNARELRFKLLRVYAAFNIALALIVILQNVLPPAVTGLLNLIQGIILLYLTLSIVRTYYNINSTEAVIKGVIIPIVIPLAIIGILYFAFNLIPSIR